MIEDKSLVRYMIGASRIKFAILDELLSDIDISSYKMCVLLVDAHSIFYRMYRDKNIANIYVDTKAEFVRDLVVGFMNVLGHYRRYIASRFHMDNDIYVVFNREPPKYQTQYCPEFGSKLYHRYSKENTGYEFVNEALDKAWPFILGLSPYFEGIYCIDNHGIDDFSVLSMTIHPENFYILFSRSMFGTQLIQPNVVQLYNKRDDSRLITMRNCYAKGILDGLKTKADEKLTPDMLPLIWAFSGCNDVSIKASKCVGKVSTMIKTMNQMVQKDELKPGMSIQSFIDRLKVYMPDRRIQLTVDRSFFIDRYRALSAEMGAAAVTADQMARIVAQCYDVYNENELEQMNELLAAGASDPVLLDIENLNMSEGFHYQ